MTNKQRLLFVALLTVGLGAAGNDTPTPQQLLDAAHKASDLSQLGSYVLTGQVVLDAGGKERRGRVTVFRSGDSVRVDLEVEGEKDYWLGLGGKSYYDPFRHLLGLTGLSDLDRSWDPGSPGLPTLVQSRFGDVKPGKVNESPVWCVDRTRGVWISRFCFDTARRVLIEESDKQSQTEFLDFAPSGAVIFPRKIVIHNQNASRVEVSRIEVSAKDLGPDTFTIPDDAIEFEGCDKMLPPKATYTPEPDFPVQARLDHPNSRVGLNIVVTKAGTVGAAQLVTPTGSALDRSAIDGVKKWRFKPATCEARPVNVTIYVEVDFRTYR